MSISILINGNDSQHLEKTVYSIRNYLRHTKYEIFIPATSFKHLPHDIIYAPKDEIRFLNTKATDMVSICIEFITKEKGDLLLFLNAGTILTLNTVNNMEQLLYSDNKIGAVGPLMNYSSYDNRQNISVNYRNLVELEEFVKQIQDKQIPAEQTLILDNSCILMRSDTMHKIGVPDNDKLGTLWTADYAMRLIEANYELWICKKSFIHCTVSSSHSQEHISNFYSKWQFNVPSYHDKAIYMELIYLIESRKKHNRFLDIGCSLGYNFIFMNKINSAVQLFGIESNFNAARIANHFGNVISENIETWDNPNWQGYFDFIVMHDTLENVNNVTNTLKKVHNWLNYDGNFILVISNAMNIDNLTQIIIDGHWKNNGENFLTRKDIILYLQQVGFVVDGQSYTKIDMSDRDKEIYNKILSLKENYGFLAEDFEALQWILYTHKVNKLPPPPPLRLFHILYCCLKIQTICSIFLMLNWLFGILMNAFGREH